MDQHRRVRSGRVRAGLAAATTLLALAACGNNDDPKPDAAASTSTDGVTVSTTLLAFDPTSVEVKKGQTVTWVGGDNIAHVLVQGRYTTGPDGLRTEETDDKAFELALSKKGQKVSHTYDTPGTFTYYCTIHRGMNGTVTVS